MSMQRWLGAWRIPPNPGGLHKWPHPLVRRWFRKSGYCPSGKGNIQVFQGQVHSDIQTPSPTMAPLLEAYGGGREAINGVLP